MPPTLFAEIDRDVRELYTRSGAVRDAIFSQRYRLRSLEQEQEQEQERHELQEMRGCVTALEQERDHREQEMSLTPARCWKVGRRSVISFDRRTPLLPKLRGHFAEFLRHGSLKRPSILYLFTCVGLGYGQFTGRITLPIRSFFLEVSTLLTMTTVAIINRLATMAGRFRGKPAISDLGWPFTPSHKSSPYFATYVGSVLQGLLELSSTCSWLDRSVSGQIGRTRRFHLWKAPTPNGLSRCSHFLADPSCKRLCPNPKEQSFKVEIPTFDGSLKLEEFINWLSQADEILDFKNVPDDLRVPYVTIRLRGLAQAWWKQLKHIRVRNGKSKISSWEKFKKHARAAFLPYNFERELYQCFQNLRQRTRSVDEYTTDFYESLARLDLNESPF
ncbi:reverse transcriptase domain-containing protein [Tanacetum coccineum]